jgi:hypothetical protein
MHVSNRKLCKSPQYQNYLALIKTPLYGKLYATRRRGRPKTRWLEDVCMDMRKMGINEWRDRARDREVWRRILMAAKE